MRPRKLAPILTAAAVVLGASSAVFAAEGFTDTADEPIVDETVTEEPVVEEPVVDRSEVEEPVVEAVEAEESDGESTEPEVEVTAEGAEHGSDDQSAFSAWAESFDDPNCHRGQTIANVARRGPADFEEFVPVRDCVPLEGRPGNRGGDGADDDDRGRPDGVGPPSNAGPPAGSGAPSHAGPPAHAGSQGPPVRADRDEDASPPGHARSRHNRNHATAESDVTEVERDDTE